MRLDHFWYVLARSKDLRPGRVLGRGLLGEWIALYRDAEGRPVALQDRCLHRGSRLSRGSLEKGCLRCPYHGWSYGAQGEVADIPTEPDGFAARIKRRVPHYEAMERDGYVYARLRAPEGEGLDPFPMPFHGAKGWMHIRLVNRFRNTVPRCAENFLDIPHTVFVHPGIFRNARRQPYTAKVSRSRGAVHVEYRGETDNFGIFSKFLNPGGREIVHLDHFHFPNVTQVEYRVGAKKRFFITSHCTPVDAQETLVYTDLTWDYGIWNLPSWPIVRWQGQAIIDQDIEVLDSQGDTARKYGEDFIPMPADLIHTYIDSIWRELEAERDPRLLPERGAVVAFRA